MKSVLSIIIVAVALSGFSQSLSNAPLANFWIANNQVNAIVENNGVVYLGGTFNYVGPNTGPGGVVNATNGAPNTGWPRVTGDQTLANHWVNKVIPDGAGGWYVAGGFSYVGPLQRPGVVRLLSNKTVATNFNANVGQINNEVSTIALSGNTLYLAGSFMLFNGQPRRGLGAVDATTGAVSSWNPQSSPVGENWSVGSIAVSGSTVYFAGSFTNVGGQFRRGLAAVDSGTGAPTAWGPDFTNSNFSALVASNNVVYVAGQIGITGPGISQVVMSLGAFDGTTGSTLWSVKVNPTGSGTYVSALALAGNTLYVGGSFTNIAGVSRRGVAALNAATGAVLAWDPGVTGIVNALAASGNTVYVGGNLTVAGGQPRLNLAALDATTGNALSGFQASAAKAVSTLAVSSNLLFAGCLSSGSDSVGGEMRNGLAALDASTGAATSWNPSSNGTVTVNALAASGSTVYVGGIFTNLGGQVRNSIAAIDANTGAASSWNPNPFTPFSQRIVTCLLLSDNLVYVGGNFTNIGGQVRQRLAALTNTTATASGWNPNASGGASTINALALDGSTIYAGGNFNNIGGQFRTNLAALDTTVGNAFVSWSPNPNNTVTTLALRSNLVYAAGTFSTIGGSNRAGLAALDSGSGAATAWNPNPSVSIVQKVALASNSLLAAGGFTTIGGSNRIGRAQLNLTNANASAWNPTNFVSSSGVATGQGIVVTLGAENVYTGGQFPGFFAAYPFAGAIQPARPALTMPMWSGGFFGFRLLGANGVSHTIQATVDFQSWSNIGTVVPSGGFADFSDTNSPLYQWRDYRARVEP